MQTSLSLQVVENPLLVTRHPSQLFQLDRWRELPRISLREILESVDYERFLNNCSSLCQKVNLENLATSLVSSRGEPCVRPLSSEEILSWCEEADDYSAAIETVSALIEQSEDILFQARLYKLLSNILDAGIQHPASSIQHPVSSIQYEDMAFELVREAIGRGLKGERPIDSSPQRPIDPEKPVSLKMQIRSDEVVWVCAPARLDFAGGWSDTPPYCLEHGGSVLNAAVKLNGQYPIQVIGKLHPEPLIRIDSIDLGERVIISETSEMLSYQEPANWSALPKAAFVVTGFVAEDTESDLQDILKELGGGVDLTLFSAVPAGSGLGTSSILGSAIIACLSRMLGQQLTQEDLFNRTLYMEQLMTTGGGWQDQIGGVVGGVKHIQTEPGLFQVPRISWTDLKAKSSVDLPERFLLYYTGLRRMAKDILRSIVGRYLDRDPVTLDTIHQLCEKSYEMKEQLDHRDIDAFGKNIGEVWELNKTLDPGTSNEQIEAILSRIGDLIYGAKLLGAGGGGFLFMVTKGIEEARKVKQILTDEPPNDRARFFDFDVDPEGLKVSVL
jgi:galactokinase/mevalonate kinase-like predicted kinase